MSPQFPRNVGFGLSAYKPIPYSPHTATATTPNAAVSCTPKICPRNSDQRPHCLSLLSSRSEVGPLTKLRIWAALTLTASPSTARAHLTLALRSLEPLALGQKHMLNGASWLISCRMNPSETSTCFYSIRRQHCVSCSPCSFSPCLTRVWTLER